MPEEPSPTPNVAAIWVEFTVAMTMDYLDEPLDRDRRQELTQDILARWRGNRQTDPASTGASTQALFESTIRWVVEHAGIDTSELPPSAT